MTQLKAIRAKCKECSGGSPKAVKYCPMDGVNSARCPLWPFRFGVGPRTAAKKYGREFLDPKAMPEPAIALESITQDAEDAAGLAAQRYAAHIATHKAIKSGRLVRPSQCQKCGSRRGVHAHHEDYAKPLLVRWLCPRCHVAQHPRTQSDAIFVGSLEKAAV